MNNQKTNVSFLAAGIFAHLFQNRQNNTNSKEILEELVSYFKFSIKFSKVSLLKKLNIV
jgi:hypothetical protein